MDLGPRYASAYVVFGVDKRRTADRINQSSKSIAGIKDELIRNEYLDTSIPSIKSAVRLLDDSHTPEWNELNQLFLRELMK